MCWWMCWWIFFNVLVDICFYIPLIIPDVPVSAGIILVNGIFDQMQKSIKINVKSASAAIKKFLEVYPHSKILGVYALPKEYESKSRSYFLMQKKRFG